MTLDDLLDLVRVDAERRGETPEAYVRAALEARLEEPPRVSQAILGASCVWKGTAYAAATPLGRVEIYRLPGECQHLWAARWYLFPRLDIYHVDIAHMSTGPENAAKVADGVLRDLVTRARELAPEIEER